MKLIFFFSFLLFFNLKERVPFSFGTLFHLNKCSFFYRENWKVKEDKGIAFQYINLVYSNFIQSCSPFSPSIAELNWQMFKE